MKSIHVLLIGLLVVLAGCSVEQQESSDTIAPDGEQSSFAHFSSEQELKSMLSDSEPAYYATPTLMRSEMAFEESAVFDTAAGSADGFAKTNNQEAGVDEADIFKTDGEFIYTASGSTLFVTSTGEDAELLSSTDTGMDVQGLFIQNDSLVVIGSDNSGSDSSTRSISYWYGHHSDMLIKVYDVSEPEQPQVLKSVEYEGYYVDARLKDGAAYIISNSGVSYDNPIPLLKVDGEDMPMPVDRIAYFPGHYDNPQLTTVHTLDLESLELVSDAVLTESTQTVYMDSHLYLSSTRYVNEWQIRQDKTIELAQRFLTEEDKELIERIEDTDSDILSPSEKKSKIQQVVSERLAELEREQQDSFSDEVDAAVKEELDSYEYREYTDIAKFSVSSEGIEAVASGEVAGRVYDSFGFDESGEVLRVVTTTSGIWQDGKLSRESENHLFSLDSDLEQIDSISGIAVGESIFSARYTADRLYLVTFEQVDPFFVIDVSDSENLEILGELKITGFSRYLHPVSEDVVLGLGREASETGRQQGLKISLFDVSDVSSPQEITKWVSDDRYASSSAEFEHKAFLMDVDKQLLVIPVSNYDRDNSYSGAYVFSLTEDSLELRGLVAHDESVERSTYIGDLLYTKSFDLLRLNDLDSLEGVADIELEQVSASDVPVY